MTTEPRHRSQRGIARRLLPGLLVVAGAVVAIGHLTGVSSASFTSASASAGEVRAASDWTPPSVSLAAPSQPVRGTMALSNTASDDASGIDSIAVQRRTAGSSDWSTACTLTSSPWSCSWDTTTSADGWYELRSLATDGAGNRATSRTVSALVDNTAPTVTMNDPGTPLRGRHTVTATASDAHSGIGSVRIQTAPAGSSTWTTRCTVTTSPYECTIDTTLLTSTRGQFSFRAVATDGAGNTSTSAAVTGRVVDNVVSTVQLAEPDALLTGTVDLRATGSSTAGLRSITVQRSSAGRNSWTDICSGTSSPTVCRWDTTRVEDGLYDLRAVLTDRDGHVTYSAVTTARRVHNVTLQAADIQARNGGVAGVPDAGDEVIYTFNREVDPSSILSGWDGRARSVSAVVDVSWFGNRSGLEISGTRLGAVDLGVRYQPIFLPYAATFASTMTASTQTVDGIPRTVVTVRLGSRSGVRLESTDARPTMTWTPASGLLDLLGRAGATTSVTESGAADSDF